MNTNSLEERKLLTSKQAKEAFINAGLSETTLHRRVNSGDIEAVLPPGRQRGAYYPEDQVIKAINNSRKTQKKVKLTNILKPVSFGVASPDEMPKIGELLLTFFSKVNVEKRKKWIERNSEVCYVLRSEGEIVGCAFVMPLEEEKILKILNSEVKPPTRPNDIQLYEPGKHYCLYIRSVVVLQSVGKLQRRYWAARLISELVRELVNMGAKGIIVDKIYAQTDMRNVERLLKAIGFMQMVSPTTAKNFVLDIATSGSIYAMTYKRALDRWLEE